jgi:hypothetical protein
MPDKQFLDRALDLVSRESRYYLLDSLHCVLFNTSNDLQGNTHEGDMDWLACRLWTEMHLAAPASAFERLDEEERQYWRRLAQAVMDSLPLFMGRIANRCQVYAAVIGEMARAERLALEKRRRGR